MKTVGRWWDGSWATLWRKDIWLKTNGTDWRVEARVGTRDRGLWARDFGGDEAGARRLVAEMLARNEAQGVTWVDLSRVI